MNRPIFYALKNLNGKNLENVLEILLIHGANPNVQNKCGEIPLLFSFKPGKTSTINLLIKYGADPKITNGAGQNALIFASLFCSVDIVKILLDAFSESVQQKRPKRRHASHFRST